MQANLLQGNNPTCILQPISSWMDVTVLLTWRNVSHRHKPTWYSSYLWWLSNFLMLWHIVPHFRQGCNEVHIIFDSPGKQQNMPKYFEHQKRDEIATVTTDHSCSQFDAAKNMVGKWRENVLNCRKCKGNVVKFILNCIGAHLTPQQMCYVAGAFDGDISDTVCFVHGKTDPAYTCNAEETDTLLWY